MGTHTPPATDQHAEPGGAYHADPLHLDDETTTPLADHLDPDGQESPTRTTLGFRRRATRSGHDPGPARLGAEPGFAHHSYGALAPACGPSCRLARPDSPGGHRRRPGRRHRTPLGPPG